MKIATPEAYQLLHEGAEALAQVEENGIRVDTRYMKKAMRESKQKIEGMEETLKQDKLWKEWKRCYGRKSQLGSGEQLAAVLVSLGHNLPETAKSTVKKPRYKSDESALLSTGLEFCKAYVGLEKEKKALNTFLRGIWRETDAQGFCHPFFNLHTTKTYRSSSNDPNFQNFPIRNPEIGKLIRSAFISRPGRHLVEIDYSGIEVRIAACYHNDPVMLEYIEDTSKDMHRDMAAQCFKMKPEQVSKQARYCGKNMFVFPQFYGDYYANNAQQMWEAIQDGDNVRLSDSSLSVKEHLAEQGIRVLGNRDSRPSPGTFLHHMQSVEKDFWTNRFAVYGKWKEKWWEKYKKEGGFLTKTGFYIEGVLGKNDVINYPVQGAAFHCLLWSLVRLQRLLKKRKMKTLIVGQIHDSIVADVPEEELQDYLELAQYVMTVLLRKKWKWIITTLEIEAEVAPVGASWHEKKEMAI